MKTTQTQQPSQHSNQEATVSAAPGATINVAALGVPVTVSTQPKPAMATKPAPAKKVVVDYTPKLSVERAQVEEQAVVATLGPDALFGEVALLYDVPRTVHRQGSGSSWTFTELS